MNIAVLGAGAIGLVFGGFLANNGHQVSLLGREEHMKPINDRGLLIEGIWGNHLITNIKGYTTIPQLLEDVASHCDLALLTVKTYDTETVLKAFRNAIPRPVLTVSLQNGLGSLEHVVRTMGPDRAMAGSVLFGAEAISPGSVRVAVHAEDIKVGGTEGRIDYSLAKDIADLFTDAAIPTVPTRDIHRCLWGKALYNCSLNGLGALLGVSYGALMEHESSRALICSIIGEIFQVLNKENQRVDWPDAEVYLQDLFERLLPLTYDHVPSMLQDLQRKKRTEINAFNGAIVALAERHGIEVPVNWLVTKLVTVREKIALGAGS
jgi:2-dehydropantoate 2-reductase